MKGLILKDFYTLRRNSRFLIAYLIFLIVISASSDNISFFAGMLVSMITMLSISTFSWDEYCGWNKYALTIPVSRKQIVMAKYAVLWILVLGGSAIGFLLIWISRMVNPEIDMKMAVIVLGLCSLAGAVMASITIPLIYRWGTEKSRLAMLMIFAAPTALVYFLGHFIDAPSEEALIGYLMTMLKCTPFLCIAVVCFSFVVSVRIFEKKEIED